MSGVRHLLPSSIQHAGDSLPGSTDGQHIIATKNRWSRIVLNYQDVSPDVWCEFSFEMTGHADEIARQVHNFAAVGVAFLMEDGSSIDFSYIPGLSRAQLDPFNHYVAGPDSARSFGGATTSNRVHCAFLIPAPTRHLTITVRGWRNSHPIQVANPTLRQFIQPSGKAKPTGEEKLAPFDTETDAFTRVTRTWKALGPEPEWLRYNLVPGHPLFLRGQIITKGTEKDGALARVVYRDADGQELPLPYPDTLTAPVIGAFINIPAHIQARRFTLELVPPSNAMSVEIGFQAWREEESVELVTPLEASLEVGLLLENISGDEQADGASFLLRLNERLNLGHAIRANAAPSDLLDALLDRRALASRLTIHADLRSLQLGTNPAKAERGLRLAGHAGWPLPDHPSWTEDPFRSLAWRQEFQSLSWLLDLARSEEADAVDPALALALSWSRSNPWGQPADELGLHPIAAATRAEALLEILAQGAERKQPVDPKALLTILGEVTRHGFALSEILGQNVFTHSIHQVHVASSLLTLAKALPRLPTAGYWTSLALACLRQGFDELIGPDGAFFEHSQHYQLEAISLGLILVEAAKTTPEASSLREHLALRLRQAVLVLIKMTDPGGMLPAYGDTPPVLHHASWLRRLINRYGQEWLADDDIRAELSYPQGPRLILLPQQGVLVARSYERGRDWSYFWTSLSEQRNSHGHYDATSFVYSNASVRWVTDPGGSTQHEVGFARQYLISSRAHNIALPDGREQGAGTCWLQSESSVHGVRVFEIWSNVHGPDYAHRRLYLMTDDLSALAVLDDFRTVREKLTFEGFLHFDPQVMVAIAQPQQVVAFQDQRRLRITPRIVRGRLSGLEIVHGLSEPQSSLQGFVSGSSGGLEPASTLRYRFSGTTRACGGVILASSKSGMNAISKTFEDERFRTILAGPE